MHIVQGRFKFTNAALTLCLGFKPDWIEIFNLTDRTGLIWSPNMGLSAANEERSGLAIAADGTRGATANAAAGVSIYAGGDKLAAASTQYLIGPYDQDVRGKQDSDAPITAWTLGNASNKTGNFDQEASTSYVGPGSRILIDGTLYEVVAMTSNGEAANEVTLDAAAPSGAVQRIWSRYDYMGAPAGEVVPKGITIGASATVNDTDGDLGFFRASNQHG